MHRTTKSVAAGSALVLIALAAPQATAADTADVDPLGRDGSAREVAVEATSTFYAGYAKTGVGEATTAASFKVPELTCGETDEGFVTTVYAISADGGFLAGSDLFSFCESGAYEFNGRLTTSGGQLPFFYDLVPGDTVRLTIDEHAVGTSTHDIVFQNLTRGTEILLPTNSPIDRIEIAHRRMSIGGVSIPPPDYGRIKFSDVVFDGVPFADADAERTRLVNDEGEVLIAPRRGPGIGDFRLISKNG